MYGMYPPAYIQPNAASYMQAQPTRESLIRVTGMEGARAYQMPPNSAAALFDGERDVFYIKSTDGAGFPTVKAFTFSPLQNPAPAGADYVTRQEFEALKEAIANGKQSFSAGQPAAE